MGVLVSSGSFGCTWLAASDMTGQSTLGTQSLSLTFLIYCVCTYLLYLCVKHCDSAPSYC